MSNDCNKTGEAALAQAHDQAAVLAAKVEALEKLVIELTLIAISTAPIKHHHKARLDYLLGGLQYAGMDPKSLDAERVKTNIEIIELAKRESPNDPSSAMKAGKEGNNEH